VQYRAVPCSTVQYRAVQCSAVLYSTVPYPSYPSCSTTAPYNTPALPYVLCDSALSVQPIFTTMYAVEVQTGLSALFFWRERAGRGKGIGDKRRGVRRCEYSV
jgi:hypothetical protein